MEKVEEVEEVYKTHHLGNTMVVWRQNNMNEKYEKLKKGEKET